MDTAEFVVPVGAPALDRNVPRREVQRILGISHTKYFELIGGGELPSFLFAGKRMVKESALKAFQAQVEGVVDARAA